MYIKLKDRLDSIDIEIYEVPVENTKYEEYRALDPRLTEHRIPVEEFYKKEDTNVNDVNKQEINIDTSALNEEQCNILYSAINDENMFDELSDGYTNYSCAKYSILNFDSSVNLNDNAENNIVITDENRRYKTYHEKVREYLDGEQSLLEINSDMYKFKSYDERVDDYLKDDNCESSLDIDSVDETIDSRLLEENTKNELLKQRIKLIGRFNSFMLAMFVLSTVCYVSNSIDNHSYMMDAKAVSSKYLNTLNADGSYVKRVIELSADNKNVDKMYYILKTGNGVSGIYIDEKDITFINDIGDRGKPYISTFKTDANKDYYIVHISSDDENKMINTIVK